MRYNFGKQEKNEEKVLMRPQPVIFEHSPWQPRSHGRVRSMYFHLLASYYSPVIRCVYTSSIPQFALSVNRQDRRKPPKPGCFEIVTEAMRADVTTPARLLALNWKATRNPKYGRRCMKPKVSPRSVLSKKSNYWAIQRQPVFAHTFILLVEHKASLVPSYSNTRMESSSLAGLMPRFNTALHPREPPSDSRCPNHVLNI